MFTVTGYAGLTDAIVCGDAWPPLKSPPKSNPADEGVGLTLITPPRTCFAIRAYGRGGGRNNE